MKRSFYLLLGLILYVTVLGFLLQFDLSKMLQPVPITAVLSGVIILTLSQFRKGITREEILISVRWNAFFSGLLTTLLSLMALFSSENLSTLNIHQIADKMIALIYGSIIYMVLHLLMGSGKAADKEDEIHTPEKFKEVFSPDITYPILTGRGFSPRECHVAIKLLEGVSNKEIAAQLFISEATVKKHIQNMFKKCGATDRQDFLNLYIQWTDERK
jgi:DNA-binding CsgD family transcriptional regulator